MDYVFNEVPLSKKKPSKLRNLLLAVVLFLSILAVREVASQNLAKQNNHSFTKVERPAPAPEDNFSYGQVITNKKDFPLYEESSEPIDGENFDKENSHTLHFFGIENFFIKNKIEPIAQNFSTSTANSSILDIGVANLAYSEGNLTALLKNYANLQLDDELCLNVSGKTKYAFICSNFSLKPFEENAFHFSFPFSEPGFYNSSLFLNRADDNPQNDNFSIKTKLGEIHDLGVDNITLESDDENPFKINIKVRIANYGDFNETFLSLSTLINNQTREYGPYNSTIKGSKTFYYSRTFNESGAVSVTFKIISYSNFGLDADEENNIKTTSIHLAS